MDENIQETNTPFSVWAERIFNLIQIPNGDTV